MHLQNLYNLAGVWLIQNWVLFVAQTPTPNPSTPKPSPVPDVELLKSQIQFLQDANTRLNNSFGSFVGAINVSFAVLALILGVAGAISVYLFNQSLKEARQLVRQEVERRLQTSVSEVVGQQVSNLQQILDREKVVGGISIDYVIPQQQPLIPDDYPEEYQLLTQRGFQSAKIVDAAKRIKLSGDVVILDLVNYQLVADTEKNNLTEIEVNKLVEDRVANQLKKLLDVLPNKAVLVVYIRPGKQRINAIDGLSQKVKYYASANTPVNLIGTVVDSAYVADAWKKC
jgi:rhodanese-related sulfurtransferase